MLKKFYIISDLHLNEKNPKILELFSYFLKSITTQNCILYILGDFFDYWIGDDDLTDFNYEVISLLRKSVQSGLKINFMRGNRDFLISHKFSKYSGVNIISEPFLINNGQQKILLMHGDLLCTDDRSYQFFRKIVRNPIIKLLYLSLMLSIRRKIVKMIRKKSQKKNKNIKKIDVTSLGIQRYIKDCQILIHGHTHLLNCHHHKEYTRYVLGSWNNQVGSFIKIDESSIQLEKLFRWKNIP